MNEFFLYFLIILLPDNAGHIQLNMSSMEQCKKELVIFEDVPTQVFCQEVIKRDLKI